MDARNVIEFFICHDLVFFVCLFVSACRRPCSFDVGPAVYGYGCFLFGALFWIIHLLLNNSFLGDCMLP